MRIFKKKKKKKKESDEHGGRLLGRHGDRLVGVVVQATSIWAGYDHTVFVKGSNKQNSRRLVQNGFQEGRPR